MASAYIRLVMAFPPPVPSLSHEEYEQFRESLAEFGASEEMKRGLETMRELKEEESSE